MAYATAVDYAAHCLSGWNGEVAEIQKLLDEASDVVDRLTYNRIRAAGGLDHLSDFQRNTVIKCVCRLAEWYGEHPEAVDNPLQSYSLNGASVTYSKAGLVYPCGVPVPRGVYAAIVDTGLCFAAV